MSVTQQDIQIAPWLESLWQSLDFDRFPNAILLHGQSGIGKFVFSIELAKALLCEGPNRDTKPCNQCEACHWFNTGNHPDFISLVPETHRKLLPHTDYQNEESPKKGKSNRDDSDSEPTEKKEKKIISIEETRSAIETLSIGSLRGGNRVILVYPLEMLRTDSANTLLKSLEEPPANTIFILLAERLDRVLPTIRSRCRLLTAPRPGRDQGLAWLKTQMNIQGLKVIDSDVDMVYDEEGGAPYDVLDSLIARHNKDDKDELTISILASRYLLQSMSRGNGIQWLDTAEKIHKAHYGHLLTSMQRWVSDLQTVKHGGAPRYYPKHSSTLESLSKKAMLPKLAQFWRVLIQARRHETHPLAHRIQLESLLSQYQQIFGD